MNIEEVKTLNKIVEEIESLEKDLQSVRLLKGKSMNGSDLRKIEFEFCLMGNKDWINIELKNEMLYDLADNLEYEVSKEIEKLKLELEKL